MFENWNKERWSKWIEKYDNSDCEIGVGNPNWLDIKTIKCPKCKHGYLSIWWDDTGKYFKCSKCKNEYPKYG